MAETPFHLHNKAILITGASSGIGRASAIACAKMGAKCVITGRDKKRLEETLAEMPGEGHTFFPADLVNESEREALVKNIPALDGLAYCAGNVKSFPIKFLNQQKIDEMMKLNFEAPVLFCSSLIKNRKLNSNSSIVFLSSISSKLPPKGGSMYASSKAAIETFAFTLAKELSPQKIRVNCVSPGMVRTPLYDRAEEAISKEEMDKHMEKYPLGAGEPDDVANAVVYFLSPASKWITGSNLILDGGFLTGA